MITSYPLLVSLDPSAVSEQLRRFKRSVSELPMAIFLVSSHRFGDEIHIVLARFSMGSYHVLIVYKYHILCSNKNELKKTNYIRNHPFFLPLPSALKIGDPILPTLGIFFLLIPIIILRQLEFLGGILGT